jgi:hypothetical protein
MGVVYIVAGSRAGIPQGPQATHFLAANAIVTAKDLVWPDIEGRYVAHPTGIEKGATLHASDLADRPALPNDPAPRLLIAMTLSRDQVAAGANVASQITLCDGAAPIAVALIETLECDPFDQLADCNAYLRLDGTAAAKITAVGKRLASLRLAATCDEGKK